jgi:hypothetical protein
MRAHLANRTGIASTASTHHGPSGGWPSAGILQRILSELRSLISPSETGRMIGLLALSQTTWSLELNPSLVGLCR